MRVYTGDELQALIESMPDIPDNALALQQLWAMKQENDVIRQPYTFEVDFSTGAGLLAGAFAAPAPGAQTVGNFLVDTSSPFMLVSQSFKSDLAGVAQTSGALIIPNQTVLIQDQSSNRNWSKRGCSARIVLRHRGIAVFPAATALHSGEHERTGYARQLRSGEHAKHAPFVPRIPPV